MPRNQLVYRCMIISPGDLDSACRAVEEQINLWNGHVGTGLNVRIDGIRGRLHVRPAMGDRPQAIVNQQLLDDADFGIALFWSRLGTPTGTHPSGSVEEIARLENAGKPVMVYFSNEPVPQDTVKGPDADQFAKLQQLRGDYERRALLGAFDSVDDLRSQLNLHVTSLISRLAMQALDRPVPNTAPQPDIRVILKTAVIVPTGQAVVSVEVQNHSPADFFFASVRFVTWENEILITGDAVTHEPLRARVIKPGDSFSLNVDPYQVLREAGPDAEFVAVKVFDRIDREFRADPSTLQMIMRRYGS
jgi:hypothetical protein